MKASYKLILISAAFGLVSPLASGQSPLSGTTLGKSQNDGRDLANSLVPGKQRFGKGEKKEEVDPQKLPTKAIKDPKFQGSLLDEGLGSSAETKSDRKSTRLNSSHVAISYA